MHFIIKILPSGLPIFQKVEEHQLNKNYIRNVEIMKRTTTKETACNSHCNMTL